MEMFKYLLPTEEDADNRPINTNSYSNGYVNDQQDLQYYKYLERVYSFWRRFLGRIQKNAQFQLTSLTDQHDKKVIEESSAFEATNLKFKHAFFSMLTLVCLLLVILLICLYLLKKNNLTFPKDRGYL